MSGLIVSTAKLSASMVNAAAVVRRFCRAQKILDKLDMPNRRTKRAFRLKRFRQWCWYLEDHRDRMVDFDRSRELHA